MNTLSEMVNDIKGSNMSNAEKKKAILSLGFTEYEATLLTGESAKVSRGNSSTYTFGVEIEMLVPSGAIRERATSNNLPIRYEGYNHTDNKRYFKFVSDSSIQGTNPIECVSPILSSRGGMKILENACKTINEAGAQVNRSTGLHVHIGAADLTDEQYCNVFQNYKMLESVIDTFMAGSRRANNSRWCRTLQDHTFYKELTKRNLLNIMNGDRYHKVNPCSYHRHQTIEFRQHQGSTDFKKISNWVKFCAKLVEWSKTNRLENPISSIEEIAFLNKTEKSFFKNRATQLA